MQTMTYLHLDVTHQLRGSCMDVDLTCPTCRHVDQVQSVPAICSGGTSSGVAYGTYTGFGFTGNGIVPVFMTAETTHTRTSALARSLARSPGFQSTGRQMKWVLLLSLPPAAFLLVSAFSLTIDSPTPIIARLLGGAFAVFGTAFPALLAGLSLNATTRRNRAIRAGLPVADRLWRSALYCHRCGHVFWSASPAPNVPTRVSLTPSHFRWTVWSAGGYARL